MELAKQPLNETGTRLTARVIADVGADVIGVVEAEDRPSLVRFNSELLNRQYDHVMLIDGNDTRGIDVAIYSRYPLGQIWTHMFDGTGAKKIFSRDCPQMLRVNGTGSVIPAPMSSTGTFWAMRPTTTTSVIRTKKKETCVRSCAASSTWKVARAAI